MSSTFASLGLERLSFEERLELIGELWDDLVSSVPPDRLLTDRQREELLRRAADVQARPDDWVSWEEVLEGSRRRLAK